MNLAGGVLFTALLVVLAGIFIGSLLLHLAAKFSGVPRATFGKAVTAFLANAILSAALSVVLSMLPIAGTFIALLLSLIATLWVLKSIYHIGWGHALLLWFMQWVVLVLLAFVFMALAGISILGI